MRATDSGGGHEVDARDPAHRHRPCDGGRAAQVRDGGRSEVTRSNLAHLVFDREPIHLITVDSNRDLTVDDRDRGRYRAAVSHPLLAFAGDIRPGCGREAVGDQRRLESHHRIGSGQRPLHLR